MKICIVSSVGGHLTEARAFKSVYSRYDHFYVLNHQLILPQDMKGKTYFICHSERDWKLLLNIWEAWCILRKEDPQLILSTGAGQAVPFALVGKILRIPNIFIEHSNQVTTPSLAGRIMYYLADRFFYQWEPLKKYFPKATFGGSLF